MQDNGVVIVATGMITAVGLDAPQTAASVRAGLCRFSETSIYNKRYEPFKMALLPDDVLALRPEIDTVTGLTSRQRRMITLASPALHEALQGIKKTESIPLFLGLPEALPDRPLPVNPAFIEQICSNAEIALNLDESRIFTAGRAAGLFALKEAVTYLSEGSNRTAIVGGVDSYLDLYLLSTLDVQNRMSGTNVMDGFIPGEGAAFMVLTTQSEARKNRLPVIASISAVATGFEEGHLYSEKPYKGDGLSGVVSSLLSSTEEGLKIADVYSSMNGENHWAKEWGVTLIRHHSCFIEEYGMHHPADCYGDTGAATGILLSCLAAIGIDKSYRRSPCLVVCSSDFGERAATLITSSKETG